MARPTNTEERRGEIVLALSRVMAREGYERATIALIAKEAGLSGGLVHYHFESKAEILHALVEGLSLRAERRIEARVGTREGGMEKLDALLDALLARGEDEDVEAVACWSLIGAEAVKDEDVRALYRRFVTRLADRTAELFEAACREAGRSAEGKKAVACALVAMIEGYFALAAAVPDAIPAGTAAKMARRAARGLVEAQPFKKERA
jgi:TetR/AcrR family transcriptional repressor of bet genes